MNLYSQILELKKKDISDTARGYQFETLIREIQPWDERPPIVMSPKSEQLDGVFTYKSNSFLIESKAVTKNITPGSKEWEDYELKLRRRNGNGFIGLYCCLYNVTPELLNRANSLNEQGFFNIVIYGSNWEQLHSENFDFKNFIDFMILNAKYKFISSVSDIKNAVTWYYDSKLINDYFDKLCKKFSSLFIRRFKHNLHEKIFVNRQINKQLTSHINLFKPSLLKKRKNDNLAQIIILRDLSGSGKTTLAIDNLIRNKYSFSFGTTANNTEIDLFLDTLLNEIEYPNIGIKELNAIDKPFLYVIDSLDEVPEKNRPQKRREIKSLIKKINELNNHAFDQKYSKFPILVLFTIREEYWRDWDSSFDGREVLYFKNRISLYTNEEFDEALINYSKAYYYNIENKLNKNSKEILSTPVNLEIFSEVNEYIGDIQILDVWEGKMLSEYFHKKHENILSKHWINNFNESIYLELLSKLSNNLILNKDLVFTKNEFFNLANNEFSILQNNCQEILKSLISEQIIIESPIINESFRFKYTRFIEYLISLYIVEKIKQNDNLKILDSFIQNIFDSQIVDIHTVLKNIKNICTLKYSSLEVKILEYYQKSEVYLNNYLPKLRGDIAKGKKTNKEDIKRLVSNTYSQNPKIIWDMFYIISAKNNKSSKQNVLTTFVLTWEANNDDVNKYRRWRLIDKLSTLRILIDEKILNILFNDSLAKDWEVYLGAVLNNDFQEDFFELWHQIGGQNILNKMIAKDKNEWQFVERLIEIIVMKLPYIIGDIMANITIENEYLTFEKRPVIIKNEHTKKIDIYLDNLTLLLNDNNSQINTLLISHDFTDKEYDYLNDEFKRRIIEVLNEKENSFFNFLIKNSKKYYLLINAIISNKSINIDISYPQETKDTLLIQIAENGIHERVSLHQLLKYIFSKDYIQNSKDDNYFTNIKSNKKEEYYLTKSYYSVNDKHLINDIVKIEKIIFILFSIINNDVIGSKFSKLIQVLNNALQHYSEYSALIIHTMQIYGNYEDMLKIESFKKKIDSIKFENQNNEYDKTLRLIFPNLF